MSRGYFLLNQKIRHQKLKKHNPLPKVIQVREGVTGESASYLSGFLEITLQGWFFVGMGGGR